ncbi:MAG: hypothetical protein H6613_12900 [Ignavibacteriales bacterium]|nr:hypothetical protein [Ignavibacteriales bacterium]
MTRSDRQAQGSLCTSAKLHEGIVNYIRFFVEDSAKKLAEQFNVSIPTIYNIKIIRRGSMYTSDISMIGLLSLSYPFTNH